MATKVVSRSVATAMAISLRASRACDVCASKSAHWYCGADAAYLCDRCDTQVHSANSLAQRHERVRLTPAGVPMKGKKRSPPVLQPARKRTRSSRPHPHRRPAAAVVEAEVAVKVESTSECNLFADFFDADFLSSSDDTHEVPSFASSSPSTSSGSEASLELPSDSLAAYFKGKAAHDEFLVPDGFDSGIDTICCDADGNISLAGEACFVPGDIPGLDAFDDCSLGFNLAQRGLSPDAFLTSTATPGDEFSNGPFAKYFVKRKAASEATPSPEVAKEILRCCEAEPRPALRLNYEEIITAWSNRGEPWVNPGDSTTEADEGRREARVLRYKEKKRTRLFSKTIRYQVRQQNAECRPRLKGRFVKRTE